MNAAETKERIISDFITRYYQWHQDLKDMPERDYGLKDMYCKPKEEMKDNMKALMYFHSHIFCGRWLQNWERDGYAWDDLFPLIKDGFLSHKNYWGRNARMTGHYNWIWINQKMAKEIYKERRAS